jgi:multidrug efflux pump subunit AcrA (membrane-fusion protein)
MKTIKNITLIFFLLTFFACKKEQEISPTVQDIKELVFASGQLEWDNAYNLTAQTDGILSKADFEVGDTINKGKILAQIDNKNNEINTQSAREQLVISNENLGQNSPALQQLEQNIQFAENKYTQDKTQGERYERLYKSESVSKLEFENIQLNAKNSLANLNALKKQYAQILQQAKQQNQQAQGGGQVVPGGPNNSPKSMPGKLPGAPMAANTSTYNNR